MTYNFYHQNDPAAPKNAEYWHSVYLHGLAEDHNNRIASEASWEWAAPDLFVCDQPMPTAEGDFPAKLYGLDVVAFIRYRWGQKVEGDYLAGRVASPLDETGFAHAQNREEWR